MIAARNEEVAGAHSAQRDLDAIKLRAQGLDFAEEAVIYECSRETGDGHFLDFNAAGLRQGVINKSGMEDDSVSHGFEGGREQQCIAFLASATREGMMEEVDGLFSR